MDGLALMEARKGLENVSDGTMTGLTQALYPTRLPLQQKLPSAPSQSRSYAKLFVDIYSWTMLITYPFTWRSWILFRLC